MVEPLPDGDPATVVRRAPFSDNPRVGVRGQRAQQRILDAALQVFGEDGYHRCGVIRITEVAGCSRAAFYQYFSSKEDVFRHLAGEVARQLRSSAAGLDDIAAGADGWRTLRDWIGRHGDIYERYEPVFRAFQAAAESDEAVASGAARIADRNVGEIRSHVVGSPLPPEHLDPVIALLNEAMTRTRHSTGLVNAVLPAPAYGRDRVDDALADIAHRTLVGLDPDVNVHAPPRKRPPRVPMSPALRDGLALDDPDDDAGSDADDDLSVTGARTLATLLQASHDVLITRGYHGTRVDDIAAAAGVSHGAFYRYFENKDHVVRLLAVRAMRTVSMAFSDIPPIVGEPGSASAAALRDWLTRYNTTHAAETAMIRVWVDATSDHPDLREESAAALDWGRVRMARFLEGRGFGDVDAEALVSVALLDAFGARRLSPSTVDAAAHIIERGLLGGA